MEDQELKEELEKNNSIRLYKLSLHYKRERDSARRKNKIYKKELKRIQEKLYDINIARRLSYQSWTEGWVELRKRLTDEITSLENSNSNLILFSIVEFIIIAVLAYRLLRG